MFRAICATDSGTGDSAIAPSTCQRALVNPRSATSASPDTSRRPLSLNVSSTRSVTASSVFMTTYCHIDNMLSISLKLKGQKKSSSDISNIGRLSHRPAPARRASGVLLRDVAVGVIGHQHGRDDADNRGDGDVTGDRITRSGPRQ